MAFKLRQENKLSGGPVKVEPGDLLRCRVYNKNGTYEDFQEEIGREITIDTVATFDVKDELGFKDGIGAIFREKSNATRS